MAKIKAYSTIEALVSATIMLLTLSISVMIITNVINSAKSGLHQRAEQRLIELALNSSEWSHKADSSFGDFYVRIKEDEYGEFTDLKATTIAAYDLEDREVTSLQLLRSSRP